MSGKVKGKYFWLKLVSHTCKIDIFYSVKNPVRIHLSSTIFKNNVREAILSDFGCKFVTLAKLYT